MGLFSKSSQSSIKNGLAAIEPALDRFDLFVGRKYGVKVSVDQRALKKCCETFLKFSEMGFPEVPGPFKRLAGFAVLSLNFNAFRFKDALRIEPKQPLEIIWGPRVVVWILPALAESMSINGDKSLLRAFDMPTRHFQVEFIGMLRSMAWGKKMSGVSPDIGLLFERCVSIGLTLEAAAYASLADTKKQSRFTRAARECSEAIEKNVLLLDDMIFNSRELVEGHIQYEYDLGGGPDHWAAR